MERICKTASACHLALTGLEKWPQESDEVVALEAQSGRNSAAYIGTIRPSRCFEEPIEKPPRALADLQQFQVQRLICQMVGHPALH